MAAIVFEDVYFFNVCPNVESWVICFFKDIAIVNSLCALINMFLSFTLAIVSTFKHAKEALSYFVAL